MTLLRLAFPLLFVVTSVFASQLLPLDPYGGSRIHNYYYACACNGLAAGRASRFETYGTFSKVLHSVNTLCLNAVWCGYTPLEHPAASLLEVFSPVTKGMVVGDFVVPRDGFVYNASVYGSKEHSSFIFFGPERTSNVDVLKSIGFPSFRDTLRFRKWSIETVLTKALPQNYGDQVFLATKYNANRDTVMSLKTLQITVFSSKYWHDLVQKGSTEEMQRFVQSVLPNSKLHFGRLTDQNHLLKLFFPLFSPISPGTPVAMKYSLTKFEPTQALIYQRHSTVIAADVSNAGLCSFLVVLEFDRGRVHPKESKYF
jgi:hypothetical protein